jgi:thiamine-monophosphate kinase
MNSSEFDVIMKYFTFSSDRDDVLLAGGDDCASVIVPEGKELVITTDTLVSGVHFPEHTSARDIAYKSLMVNLSDLASMGATPAWLTLAITLPEIDDDWLHSFSRQMSSLLSEYNVALIGGDTTRGPLSITIQAMGLVPRGKKLLRSQAMAGDKVYVTGYIGDAAVGLRAVLDGNDDEMLVPCINRLNRPDARIAFAQDLIGLSRCAIDISDGLVADIGHIIEQSNCGVVIELDKVPVWPSARDYFSKQVDVMVDGKADDFIDWSLLLTGGDDYELCFTVEPGREHEVFSLAEKHGLLASCIGTITEDHGLRILDDNNEPVILDGAGYQHF